MRGAALKANAVTFKFMPGALPPTSRRWMITVASRPQPLRMDQANQRSCA